MGENQEEEKQMRKEQHFPKKPLLAVDLSVKEIQSEKGKAQSQSFQNADSLPDLVIGKVGGEKKNAQRQGKDTLLRHFQRKEKEEKGQQAV